MLDLHSLQLYLEYFGGLESVSISVVVSGTVISDIDNITVVAGSVN